MIRCPAIRDSFVTGCLFVTTALVGFAICAGCGGSTSSTADKDRQAAAKRAEKSDAKPAADASKTADSAETPSDSGQNHVTPNPADDDTAADGQDPESELAKTDENSTDSAGNPSSEVQSNEQQLGQGHGNEADNLPAHRLLLFLPGELLLIELAVAWDNAPWETHADRYYDSLVEPFDLEPDETLTWKAFWASDLPERFSVTVGSEQERQQLQQSYDRNADGMVTRDELLRVLGRNQGLQGAVSFRVISDNRGDNQTRSPLRLLLDQDQNGVLSKAELSHAGRQLRKRDLDGDDMLTVAEFTNPTMQSERMVRRNVSDVAAWLDEHTRWSHVLELVQDHMAFGGDLERELFAEVPHWFDALDTNRDGMVTIGEIPELANIPADARIVVRFTEGGGGPELQVHAGSLAAEQTTAATSAFKRPTANITCFALDQYAGVSLDDEARGTFNQLDTNADGYLVADELPGPFPGLQLPFASLDLDGDEKVFWGEVAEIAERRRDLAALQLTIGVRDEPDAFFAVLDRNRDERLSPRELDNAGEVLRSFDENADDELWPSEIPGAMVVAVVRGVTPIDSRRFPALPAATPENADIPDWFRSMDTNRDGLVAEREYLGPLQMFTEMDSNRDGYVDAAEITNK